MDRIKIVRIPEGEAPESVRKAWVGLELPSQGVGTGVVDGILTQKPWKAQTYWAVPQDEAINILGQSDPTAAQWYRDLGFPMRGYLFTFWFDEAEFVGN